MFIMKQNRPRNWLYVYIKTFKIGSLTKYLSNAVISVSVKVNWYFEMCKRRCRSTGRTENIVVARVLADFMVRASN